MKEPTLDKPQIYKIDLRESKYLSGDSELMLKAEDYLFDNPNWNFLQFLQFIEDYQFEPWIKEPYQGSDKVLDREVARQKIIRLEKLLKQGDILIIYCWRFNQWFKGHDEESSITMGISMVYYFDGYDLIRTHRCYNSGSIFLPNEVAYFLQQRKLTIADLNELYQNNSDYKPKYSLIFSGLSEKKDKLD